MGVQTSADDYRDRAREALNAADEALATFMIEVFIRRCWGHDEFRDGYEQEVREAVVKMRQIKDAIG